MKMIFSMYLQFSNSRAIVKQQEAIAMQPFVLKETMALLIGASIRMVLHAFVERFFKLTHCIERKVEWIILLKITCVACSINPSIMTGCAI